MSFEMYVRKWKKTFQEEKDSLSKVLLNEKNKCRIVALLESKESTLPSARHLVKSSKHINGGSRIPSAATAPTRRFRN